MVYRHNHVILTEGREAVLNDYNTVRARYEVVLLEVARFVGGGGNGNVAIRIRNRYLGAGHPGSRGVQNGSDDVPVDGLGT
jgi:hypothetical protein